jgi:hypothetical protein
VSEKKTGTAMVIGSPRKHTRIDREMELLLEKYLERHPDHESPLDPDVICQWALDAGIYVLRPIRPVDQLKERFCRHLGHRYFTDPQNREVRALHAVPYEEPTLDGMRQGYRYYPLFTTEPDKIKLSFQLRRLGALNRVVQIETDRVSYNDNNVFGAKIEQMSFDFDTEFAERRMPTDYPDSAPDDIDQEDDLPR